MPFPVIIVLFVLRCYRGVGSLVLLLVMLALLFAPQLVASFCPGLVGD